MSNYFVVRLKRSLPVYNAGDYGSQCDMVNCISYFVG